MKLPSKKLLSAVLKVPVTLLRIEKDNEYFATTIYTEHGELNIYELAHKCKEWVLTTGYFLESGLPYKTRATSAVFNDTGGFIEGFESPSEPEAIFEACEWIFNSQK